MSSPPAAVEIMPSVRYENLLHLPHPYLEDREKRYRPAVLGHSARVQQLCYHAGQPSCERHPDGRKDALGSS
jgi:hypothetical protein